MGFEEWWSARFEYDPDEDLTGKVAWDAWNAAAIEAYNMCVEQMFMSDRPRTIQDCAEEIHKLFRAPPK
jgi:hypothetical protein